MRRVTWWWVLPCAGLLAAGSGCASRQASESPTARRVASAQEQSQAALDRTAKAQERATEQGERVAQAQRELQEAQRRLSEAQARVEQEQVKAERLQREAIQAREEATPRASAAQQEASRALTQQGEHVQRQEQTFSGQVTQASADSLVVTPETGEPMTFKITDATEVRIDGRRASAADVQQGADARVAYQISGAEAAATTVQVMTGQPSQEPQPPAREGETATPPAQPPSQQRP
jgi:colicin import membrane protein